jgi:hypothetical protein
MRSSYKILVGKPEKISAYGRHGRMKYFKWILNRTGSVLYT